MSRIEQINELLKHKLAELIVREIPLENGLVTITYVDCSPDLNWAKIGVSVIPDKFFGTTLKELRRRNSEFTRVLKKETRLRKIPKFNWMVDSTEKEAAELEEAIKEIKDN